MRLVQQCAPAIQKGSPELSPSPRTRKVASLDHFYSKAHHQGDGVLDVGHQTSFSGLRWQDDGEDRKGGRHQRFKKKDLRLWKNIDFCLCFCFFLMMGTHTSPHTSIMSPRDRKAGPIILRAVRYFSTSFRV